MIKLKDIYNNNHKSNIEEIDLKNLFNKKGKHQATPNQSKELPKVLSDSAYLILGLSTISSSYPYLFGKAGKYQLRAQGITVARGKEKASIVIILEPIKMDDQFLIEVWITTDYDAKSPSMEFTKIRFKLWKNRKGPGKTVKELKLPYTHTNKIYSALDSFIYTLRKDASLNTQLAPYGTKATKTKITPEKSADDKRKDWMKKNQSHIDSLLGEENLGSDDKRKAFLKKHSAVLDSSIFKKKNIKPGEGWVKTPYKSTDDIKKEWEAALKDLGNLDKINKQYDIIRSLWDEYIKKFGSMPNAARRWLPKR